MKDWLLRKIKEYRERRRFAREIDPESFRVLARELRELASVAERLWPRQPQFHSKIKRIQTDMEQLDRLTTRPEFKRLSAQKRMQLRKSLIQSRQQLMETVQTAPSPTATLQ
jgi:hypothetical protein